MLHRIAITGGSGFIGAALADSFSDSFQVRILDTRETRSIGAHVEYVQCDVRNSEEIERALMGVDLVIHTAIVQIPHIDQDRRLGYEVNVIGTQNVCEAIRESPSAKGLILTGSWHTIGETDIRGLVDERFGLRPDKVEERARMYALTKMAQEAIVRVYDEESQDKVYGIVRIGTALGENMPEKTAANIFIDKALRGEALTPYDHSMHRPMLYVDVQDVCRAFRSYAQKILNNQVQTSGNSLGHVVNVYYPEPTTILELAEIVKQSVMKCTNGRMKPEFRIVKTGQPSLFTPQDKQQIRVDITKAKEFLGLERLASPSESIDRIVSSRVKT